MKRHHSAEEKKRAFDDREKKIVIWTIHSMRIKWIEIDGMVGADILWRLS